MSSRERRTAVITLTVLIVLVSVTLRVHRISEQQLWLDESISFHLVNQANWLERTRIDSNPPLYYLLLRGWVGLFDASRGSIRMLSAVLGSLFVLAVIVVGSSMFRASVGLWAGMFASLAPMHIYYSQEARGYSLLLLMIVLSYGTLDRAFRRNSWRWWMTSSLCCFLAIATHYFALIALLPTVLFLYVWPFRQRCARYVVSMGCSVALFVPWVIWSYATQLSYGDRGAQINWISRVWEATPPLLAIPRSLEVLGLASQARLLPISLKQLSLIEFPGELRLLGLTVLGALGICAALPWGDKWLGGVRFRRLKTVIGIAVVGPLATLWLVSLIKPLYVVGRYDMISFPAYALMVGLALAKLQSFPRSGPYLAGVAFLLLVLPIGWKLHLYYGAESSVRAERIASALSSNVRTGDSVVFSDAGALVVLANMYDSGFVWNGLTCENEATAQRVECRIFSPVLPAWLVPGRVISGATAIRREYRDFLSQELRTQHDIWVVAGGRQAHMTMILTELERRGFRMRQLDRSLGIAHWEYAPSPE